MHPTYITIVRTGIHVAAGFLLFLRAEPAGSQVWFLKPLSPRIANYRIAVTLD